LLQAKRGFYPRRRKRKKRKKGKKGADGGVFADWGWEMTKSLEPDQLERKKRRAKSPALLKGGRGGGGEA